MNATTEAQHLAEVCHSERSEESAVPPPLADDERQRCEVWTRVMGYHRPVASFNVGKKGEHAERRFFRESRASAHF
jgi:hypothetical protein